MPYVESSTTGEQHWDYSERDNVIRWFSDQYRTAAERFARRVEEYLHDSRSSQYMDPVYLDWAVAMFDREKQGSGGYLPPYDPMRVAAPKPSRESISTSSISVENTAAADPLVDAYRAGYEVGYEIGLTQPAEEDAA
jgi:hypothetical protein